MSWGIPILARNVPTSGCGAFTSFSNCVALIAAGDCNLGGTTSLRIQVTLNDPLPANTKVQYRWGTTNNGTTPSFGSWTDWGTFSGTQNTITLQTNGEGINWPFFSYVRVLRVQARVVEVSTSNVCVTSAEDQDTATVGPC